MCSNHIQFICEMGKKMMTKFSKYWKINLGILAIASVLDLHYKMISVEYYLKEIYGVAREQKFEDINGLLKKL